MRDIRMGRGVFLGVVGTGVAGLFVGSRLSKAAAPLGAVVPSALHSLIPDGWRIYSVNPPWPTFDPATYRLTIDGAVSKPLTLTWDDVMGLPQASQTTTFHCVTGWTVSNVHWRGVRLSTLWDMVQPTAEAKFANFISMEQPYVDTLSMAQTTLPQVMLAHTMGNAPLSRAHGAPMRLIIPGYDVDAWVGRSNGY